MINYCNNVENEENDYLLKVAEWNGDDDDDNGEPVPEAA
jgi:hypothetical protein